MGAPYRPARPGASARRRGVALPYAAPAMTRGILMPVRSS
jgi:hypothetical protein